MKANKRTISSNLLTLIEERLNILNLFILGEISTPMKHMAYAKLCKMMDNRNDFINSTISITLLTHPKFISYLQQHGLTEWEIGCCCLYQIGFRGTDISEYLHHKAIYNSNSNIRHKLGIPKNHSSIEIFLKQKMQELENE